MRVLAFALTLLVVLSFSQRTTAGDSDDGPVLITEFTYLDISDDDDMYVGRMVAGWALDVGIQFGANLAFYYLDRSSVNGVTYTKPPVTPFPGESERTYTLDPEFTYWGFGPVLGYDLELVEEWFGLEFMVTLTFPVTNDASGLSIEVGSYAYLSSEWLTGKSFHFVLMGGGKYGHYDVDADRYPIEQDVIMPGLGVMLQF